MAMLTTEQKRKLISLIDLTRLEQNDNENCVRSLCQMAKESPTAVAAVCLYPSFIKLAKSELAACKIKIATVVNFPRGRDNSASVNAQIKQAIADGADEIDMVMPYYHYFNNEAPRVADMICAAKQACGPRHLLKVILETGELKQHDLIITASHDAIRAGADFLKTSTGKVELGATLKDAQAILSVIQLYPHRKTGLKVSGGIRCPEQALDYLNLAKNMMGETFISSKTLRFGSSSLLQKLID